jgi:hypothetical protein
MEPITDMEFEKNTRAIYESVFASEDPYRKPFQPTIQPRLLLYWFRYGLLEREAWLIPVTKAIRALGEDGFYLTLLGQPGPEPHHWYVPIDEASLYIKTVFPCENAIYSVNGRWGIMCSEEDHAIAAGPQEFIDIIYNSVPDWDYRLNLFLENWKGYHKQNNRIKIDWLPTLLSHVYGVETTQKMLQDSQLEWLISDNLQDL